MKKTVATDRFRVGDQVAMTEYAISAGFNGRSDRRRGIVVGTRCREPHLVRIRRDGERAARLYHADLWRKDQAVDGAATQCLVGQPTTVWTAALKVHTRLKALLKKDQHSTRQ